MTADVIEKYAEEDDGFFSLVLAFCNVKFIISAYYEFCYLFFL